MVLDISGDLEDSLDSNCDESEMQEAEATESTQPEAVLQSVRKNPTVARSSVAVTYPADVSETIGKPLRGPQARPPLWQDRAEKRIAERNVSAVDFNFEVP